MQSRNKFGLLVTSPVGPDKNIGDYIQSLAALQFIPDNSSIEYVEKEQISDFSSDEKIKVIMNAWYIWHPENWPPKESAILPLLTSIHLSPLTADKMMSKSGKDYFIKHSPIGCRDIGTSEILTKHRIPNFFSGCLTLSLGKSYKHKEDASGIIFVDPYFPPIRYVNQNSTTYFPGNVVKSIWYFIKSPRIIKKLAKKSFFKGRLTLQTYYNAAMFYHAYSNMFTDKAILDGEYVSHMIPVKGVNSQEEWLNIARSLLNKYSKAKFVVTSRIHCALPCLGIGTPVIFVLDKVMNDTQNIFNAPGRFGGLLDFFRVARYQDNKVTAIDSEIKTEEKLSEDFSFKNKTNWIPYKENLVKSVEHFINN